MLYLSLKWRSGLHGKNFVREWLENLNDEYLKGFFQKEPEKTDEADIMDLYETILLHQVRIDEAKCRLYERVAEPIDKCVLKLSFFKILK